MNDDRRSVLDHVRNRIDWVDESISKLNQILFA